MGVKIGKPILVSGLGITIALGVWEAFHSRLAEVGEWGMIGAIAVGAGLWFFRKPTPSLDFLRPSPLNREKVLEAIERANTIVNYLEKEAPETDISALKQEIAALPRRFDRQTLQVAIAGTRKTGKTALQEVLSAKNFGDGVSFVETEPLLTITGAGEEKTALASDLVLYLVNGDLTDSEWQILQEFDRKHLRSLLLLTKQDRLHPEEKEEILLALKQRIKDTIPVENILSIAAAPEPMKVRQHQADGEIIESIEPRQIEIDALENRLTRIFQQERESLVFGTLWREAVALQERGKSLLNESRRKRAIPVIEQYQWIAAATAFANPVAALDLVAAAAINGQMLVDLGEIYQQKISLAGARTAAETIGKLMVQLGVVEVTTQAIGALLKGNALTYIAGGTVQGVSAAYLTRLAGLSVIEYFQEQEITAKTGEEFNLDRLARKIKQIFEQNQRIAFLQDFVKQAIPHLAEAKVAG
ncbi:slr1306 family protein [Pannus brasiliensis]